MRILHVIDSMRRGGAERMLVDIANQSHAAGHDVHVCITRGGAAEMADELARGVTVHVLDRRSRYDVRGPIRLVRLLRALRPDVVHMHARSTLPLVVAARIAARTATPLLLHDHFGGIENDTSIPAYFPLARWALAHYVGVSEALGRWARGAGVPDARVSVIENAIDLRRFDGAPDPALRATLAPGDRLLGVLVANQHRNKGIEVMLDALGAARHRERVHVVVCGEAPNADYARSLVERRDALGLRDHVSFLGARDDVPAILRSADFALHSSHTESGPLVLVEYVACGLPFAATCTGSIGRRLRDAGVPGFVAPGDAAAMAEAIDAIVELEPAARRERGASARTHLETWDLEPVMQRWYRLYAAISGGARR